MLGQHLRAMSQDVCAFEELGSTRCSSGDRGFDI